MADRGFVQTGGNRFGLNGGGRRLLIALAHYLPYLLYMPHPCWSQSQCRIFLSVLLAWEALIDILIDLACSGMCGWLDSGSVAL